MLLCHAPKYTGSCLCVTDKRDPIHIMSGPQAIYQGSNTRTESTVIGRWLQNVPPWRRLDEVAVEPRIVPSLVGAALRRATTYVSSGPEEIQRVNIALLLRRPILVTGEPGLGKSTLAYNIAHCLNLGAPLRWEINSQTSLQDGLYVYDAVGHLQSAQAAQRATKEESTSIGDFITLGPLGTALLPTPVPRVLLIDELDKGSFDLPNDLLHVIEEGSFVIPELIRTKELEHSVFTFDRQHTEDRVNVTAGRVRSLHHPVVVITSNGEKPFPEAFLRRCVELRLTRPTDEHLEKIIRAHFQDSIDYERMTSVLKQYSGQATDVLLQGLFLQQHIDSPFIEILNALRR